MNYAEVIMPLPLYSTFTFHIPDHLAESITVGCRVLVPFGQKKLYTGIVAMVHNRKPQGYEVKDIDTVLDGASLLRHPQLKFWQWIADYYLCPIGDVYKAAVPSGLKVESETRISANPDFIDTDGTMSKRDEEIYRLLLARKQVTPAEISRATGYPNVEASVVRLLEREAVYVTEKVVDTYRPKTEVCVKMNASPGDTAAINEAFAKVRNAKKQETALLAFLELSGWAKHTAKPIEVTKEALAKRADVSPATLKAMVDKGIFTLYKREVNRFHLDGNTAVALNQLSEPQLKAYNEIVECFRDKSVTLLHGVTSSGKTEIYTHLINDALQRGMQALYLVPEIALTTQLTQRLHKNFGDRLLIYHSKFSDNERVDIWRRLLHSNDPCVVIGVRSSVFLPFGKLGVVIVDEEHETTYKQQDPSPRYNARDAALVLASMHGAKTLLGSATPSVTTYYNAVTGKYGLVKLTTRYEGVELPLVRVVDTTKARKRKEMHGAFSSQFVNECSDAIARGEQVIIFQNRRGFSPMVRCRECAWTPKCVNCDVTLTYHKFSDRLTCHYCGYSIPLPTVCPACRQPAIEVIGYGTERIEDDLEKCFPDAKIARMDLDTTRSKTGYEKIIDSFSNHRTQILVGTQMVTKGLDFEGVSVVGIVNADLMINFPDFRSHERAFNMMEQVAGRAGRRHKQGIVCIQTSSPDNPVIKYVVDHDYEGFYRHELEDRRRFAYPPFTRIINIFLRHRDRKVLEEMAGHYSSLLRQVFGSRVLGPEPATVPRLQNLYIFQIVLKVETTASMSKVKQILRALYEKALAEPMMKNVKIHYDVDPA